MEYILRETDLFDMEIGNKFSEVIKTSLQEYDKGSTYKLSVDFHVNLLNDSRLASFEIPATEKKSGNTIKDKMYGLLRLQLNTIEKVLEENGVKLSDTTIRGNSLEVINIIKIDVKKDERKVQDVKGRKNKKPMKVSVIVPSISYTSELATKLASDRLRKIFVDLMCIIKNRHIMSEILDVPKTEDVDLLFKAFTEQYRELWLTTDKRGKELLDRFQDKALFIANKYANEADATN